MTDSAFSKKQLINQCYHENNKDRTIKNVIARKNDKRQGTISITPYKSLEILPTITMSNKQTPLRKKTSHFKTTHRPIHIYPTRRYNLINRPLH